MCILIVCATMLHKHTSIQIHIVCWSNCFSWLHTFHFHTPIHPIVIFILLNGFTSTYTFMYSWDWSIHTHRYIHKHTWTHTKNAWAHTQMIVWIKQNHPKQSKMKQKKSRQIPLSSFCVSQLSLSMGPALRCIWYTHWDFIGENWVFPLPMGINYK